METLDCGCKDESVHKYIVTENSITIIHTYANSNQA